MALSQYYVDPSIAGNSGTGTSGDPYGDLQYALNSITRNSTDGDQINIKAGTAEVLAAALTLATYGTPTEAAPLIMRGYTSAANDGGIGEINCNGVKFWTATTYTNYILIDLKIHNGGNNHLIDSNGAAGYIALIGCEVYKGASSPSSKYLFYANYNRNVVIGCYFHDAGTSGVGVYGQGVTAVYFSRFKECVTAINGPTWAGCVGNVISSPSGGTGVLTTQDMAMVVANSVYGAASTGNGVDLGSASTSGWGVAINNVIEGFSGTGGKAVRDAGDALMLHSNAYYNNATNESTVEVYVSSNNDTAAASPFVNAGSDDFDINGTVTGVTEDAYPASFISMASTAPKADKGAVQAGAGAASSGGGPIFGGHVVR